MSADVVAIIPARGGSTRIPRKNEKVFNGKPIIAWPLEACRALDAISHRVVSTDDEELARIARDSGATTVIDRPTELATDLAGTAPVIKHAIDELGVDDDTLVMCLYPTATLTPHLVSVIDGTASSAHAKSMSERVAPLIERAYDFARAAGMPE